MTKKTEEDTLTLTRAELESAIKAGAEAAVAASRNTLGFTSPTMSTEERIHAQLGTPVPDRDPTKTYLIPCANPRNGATFTAVVVPSREFEAGRVVRLDAYHYPEDIEKRARKAGKRIHLERFGGSDPRDSGKQGLAKEYLQWRYETYHKADMGAYQGQSAAVLPRCGEAVEWMPDKVARSA